MLPGYAYTAILVTGILHGILGFCNFVTSISGLSGILRLYCGVALAMSLWILVVAGLGITAGLKNLSDEMTRKFKIAYMVTAILSACIFSLTGLIMFCWTFMLGKTLGRDWEHYITIGHVGSVFMSMEFVLSIVSSSICCCCSTTTAPTTVIIQSPAAQPVKGVQYQPPIYQPAAP